MTVLVRVSTKAYKKVNQVKAQFAKQGVKISVSQALDAYICSREGKVYELKYKGAVVRYSEV